MKVLQVFTKLDRGGAELRTISLAKELKRYNITFDYLCLSGEKGSLDEEVLNGGSKIHYIKLRDLKFPIKFWKMLKSENYDAVHSHVLFASGIIQLIAKKSNVSNRISHFRSTGSGKKETIIRKIREKFLLKLLVSNSTNILCVSESVKNAIFKNFKTSPQNVRVIYNGFSEDSISKLDKMKSEKIVIHVGRMIPDKNHIKVLEIFNEIYKVDNSYKLRFVGQIDSNIKTILDEYIKDHSLKNKVEFMGVCTNIPDLFKTSTLMIFPSKREGLPGSVIEALINGVPVLGSNITSIKELEKYFKNLKCLSIDEPADTWSKAAFELIAKTKNNPRNREDLVMSLNNSVFSMENNIKQILRVYK